MKTWTIGRRIIFGYALLIVVVAGVGLLSYSRMTAIDSASHVIVTDSLPGLLALSEVNGLFRTNVSIALEHIIADTRTEKDQFEAELKKAQARIDALFAEYEKAISDPKDRELFDALNVARREFRKTRDEVVLPLSRDLKSEEAERALKMNLVPLYDKYLDAVENLMSFNRENALRAGGQIQAAAHFGKNGVIIGAGLGLLISIGLALVIIRSTANVLNNVTGLLNSSSDQVASASAQVSSSSQSLAEGASEQAASLEETSASLEEMASMTRRSAENAQSAKELANQARVAADTGASDMARMDSAMLEIKQAGDNIAKIIKTIDEIAFQTNILALNAAVEAARAGEAGMGFAVVADEVRSLAQRSAQAAKETAEKIEDCIRKSEAGVAISSKVGTSLNEILSKATQVDELVAEIATASREQSQGIDQVNTALTQMDKVTQNNAASAEESASAAEELNAQAQALKNAVGDLQQLVGGSGAITASNGAATRQLSKAHPANSASMHGQPFVSTTQNGAHSLHGSPGMNGSAKGYTLNSKNGSHGTNGNGKKPHSHPAAAPAHNRNVIPLEDEFQDF